MQATDQRRNSWLNEVHVHTDSVIKINQYNFQQSWVYIGNLRIVSTDNPVIMLISSFIPWFYAGETFPTVMSPWNLHKYITFYHKMLGGQKILCPPCPKVWGDVSPPSPHKLGPWPLASPSRKTWLYANKILPALVLKRPLWCGIGGRQNQK